jgi:hypothetical protein
MSALPDEHFGRPLVAGCTPPGRRQAGGAGLSRLKNSHPVPSWSVQGHVRRRRGRRRVSHQALDLRQDLLLSDAHIVYSLSASPLLAALTVAGSTDSRTTPVTSTPTKGPRGTTRPVSASLRRPIDGLGTQAGAIALRLATGGTSRFRPPSTSRTWCVPPSSARGMVLGSTGAPSSSASAIPRHRRSGFKTAIS